MFVGTLYPLALEALTGEKISVGAPFFNLTFGPLFVPLLLAVPFGPMLAWKRGDLLGVVQRLIAAIIIGLIGVAATFAVEGYPVLPRSASALRFMSWWVRSSILPSGSSLFARRRLPSCCGAHAACRVRSGERRWRISASA